MRPATPPAHRPLPTLTRSLPPWWRLEGTVSSPPQTVPAGPGAGRPLTAIVMILVLLAALPLLIMVLAPLLIVMFFFSRYLGPWVMWPLTAFGSLLRFGGGGHGHRQHTALQFRVRDENDRIVAVQLRTHHAPLELGDHVVVHGVRIGGLMRAARVANTSTGQTVYAPALMVAAAIAAFFVAITLIGLLSFIG